MNVVSSNKVQKEYCTRKPMAWQSPWWWVKSSRTPTIEPPITDDANKPDRSVYIDSLSLKCLYILKKTRRASAVEQDSIPANPPLLNMATSCFRASSERLRLQSGWEMLSIVLSASQRTYVYIVIALLACIINTKMAFQSTWRNCNRWTFSHCMQCTQIMGCTTFICYNYSLELPPNFLTFSIILAIE